MSRDALDGALPLEAAANLATVVPPIAYEAPLLHVTIKCDMCGHSLDFDNQAQAMRFIESSGWVPIGAPIVNQAFRCPVCQDGRPSR